MILLTEELRAQLRANARLRFGAQKEAQRRGAPEPDPVPVVKFFDPMGAATWLATEIEDDGDTLFGLADLGFGCPELGSFSLAEIASVRLAFGLGIERDLGFQSTDPLSIWVDTARRCGTIIEAEARLRRAAQHRAGEFSAEMPPTARDTAKMSDPDPDHHSEIPAPPAPPQAEGPISAGDAG